MQYKTRGTCSVMISFDVNDDDTVSNIQFLGGCNGNLKGIGVLAEGQNIDTLIEKLSGITCGPRPTSCPDQLARALKQYREDHPAA
ncbi:MAG: TIGR03905 family TSCPD domain-containing protein [Lachnospiraceae bacterium]|nr:TIGR03905 family TSCPD domain-containing protein [Lachnospiraceae bacterium]